MIINVNNDGMVGNVNEKTLHIELIKKDKKIERLNNILNELEDTLINKIRQIDERIKKDKIKPYGIEFELNECAKNRYREMLDKIKELKGEDKE